MHTVAARNPDYIDAGYGKLLRFALDFSLVQTILI